MSTNRKELIKEIELSLGGQMVDVELDPEHYNLAVDRAVQRLRQRTDGSMEESYLFLTLQPDTQEYQLPDEVQEVRAIHRRGVATNSTSISSFDPFEGAFSQMYLMQSGRSGSVATWEFFSSYQETIARVFASAVNFTWSPGSRTLTVIKHTRVPEEVVVHVFNQKPEISLFKDPYTAPWIRDYALAQAKMMLGTARGKITSGLPGPNSTITLDGEQLKAEAQQEMERLDEELKSFVTSNMGMPFIIA